MKYFEYLSIGSCSICILLLLGAIRGSRVASTSVLREPVCREHIIFSVIEEERGVGLMKVAYIAEIDALLTTFRDGFRGK